MNRDDKVLWAGLVVVMVCVGYALWSHSRLERRLQVIEGQQQILLRMQAEAQSAQQGEPVLAVEPILGDSD